MTDILDRFDRQLTRAGKQLYAAGPSVRKPRLRPGVIAVIVVALTGGVAVAATTLHEPGPSVSAAPNQPVLAGFSALSNAPAASPADAAAIQRNLDNRPTEKTKSGAELLPRVAEVSATADHRSVVALGPKYVCMQTFAINYSSSACTTHVVATNPKTPMVDVTVVDNGYLVSALLPDGVSAASLRTKGGSRTTLMPKQNFASVVVADPPDQMILSTADGPATVALAAVATGPTRK